MQHDDNTNDARDDGEDTMGAKQAYHIIISEADRAMYARALRHYHEELKEASDAGNDASELPDDPEEVETHIAMLEGIENETDAGDAVHDFTV